MERSMLHLAEGLLNRGHQVDMVVNQPRGAYLDQIPEGIRLVTLDRRLLRSRLLALRAAPRNWRILTRSVLLTPASGNKLPHLHGMVRYLQTQVPDALIAASPFCNLVATWGRQLAGTTTRVIVSERNTLKQKVMKKSANGGRWRHLPALVGCTYPDADGIVAVSDGVAADLVATAGLPAASITTIYNPVVTPGMLKMVDEPSPHPWLEDGGTPVIVAAGRLVPQKGFATLLQAFARVLQQQPARLLILGEGPERDALLALGEQLDIRAHIDLPGFETNPYAAFARADLFVLSSEHEGLPGVLIQALACGCPVVSTDCPSGPVEILEDGRYGKLVPVNDAVRMGDAMLETLANPLPTELLKQRGGYFSLDRSVELYLQLLPADQLNSTNTSTTAFKN
ncbi:glycosyltransferase involved in cell wall biosynthesis [Kushneria sinocarnis]|uniref:Glycosyltransferase involved in cell wall biosynthesis n=1 Tax=Kushneria sinocarnis TaxID=595502 RepID=A0A420X071_9GAMM|nr:glycosyltransferase [Kushneria sinocarnis]RKR06952.1 glycosyltransferase involved in cell wall biosynthesis [Kushneria sinocarnis]